MNLFWKIFPLYNFQWKDIYKVCRKVTINAYLRSFQYKILNNVVYLNKNLHTFGLSWKKGQLSHLFYYCSLCKTFGIKFRLSSLTDYIFHNKHHRLPFLAFIILTMKLFLFKITYYFYSNYIYAMPEKNRFLYFNNFLNEISKIKNLEKRVAE